MVDVDEEHDRAVAVVVDGVQVEGPQARGHVEEAHKVLEGRLRGEGQRVLQQDLDEVCEVQNVLVHFGRVAATSVASRVEFGVA